MSSWYVGRDGEIKHRKDPNVLKGPRVPAMLEHRGIILPPDVVAATRLAIRAGFNVTAELAPIATVGWDRHVKVYHNWPRTEGVWPPDEAALRALQTVGAMAPAGIGDWIYDTRNENGVRYPYAQGIDALHAFLAHCDMSLPAMVAVEAALEQGAAALYSASRTGRNTRGGFSVQADLEVWWPGPSTWSGPYEALAALYSSGFFATNPRTEFPNRVVMVCQFDE
jgi:hypothetical protein